jgi:hypothetical protein
MEMSTSFIAGGLINSYTHYLKNIHRSFSGGEANLAFMTG